MQLLRENVKIFINLGAVLIKLNNILTNPLQPMKKIYFLLSGLLLAGGTVSAQRASLSAPMHRLAVDNRFEEVREPASASGNRAVIYTNDFSTPADWNIATTGQGTWQIVTTTPADITQYIGAMASTTAVNGFAVFNGIQFLLAANVDPQNTTVTLANSIDLSANPAVLVEFEQRYRRFNSDECWLEVSADNGATWTNYRVNNTAEYPTNGPVMQNTVSRNVTTALGGAAQALVRFRWVNPTDNDQYGSGYAWMIDDFKISDAALNDLVLTMPDYHDASSPTTWGAPIRYTRIGTGSVHATRFVGKIENVGFYTQDNTHLSVEVDGAANPAAFSGAGTSTNLASLGIHRDSTAITFTPAGSVETYTANFEAVSDSTGSDETPANNVATRTFQVTANEFGRDNDVYTASSIWAGETGGLANAFVTGPIYEAKENLNVNRVRVAFGPQTEEGALVCAQIYHITTDFELLAENCDTPYELSLTSDQISSGGTVRWVDFLLCAQLQAGEFYLVAVKTAGGTETVQVMSGGVVAPQAGYDDPGPSSGSPNRSNYLFDGGDNTWYYTVNVPKVRFLTGACDISVTENEAKGLNLGQNVPNPFNGTSLVSYSLTKEANVTFEVVDITGKVVKTMNLGRKAAGDYNLTLNSSEFAPGVYFYTMTTGAERISKRMVVTE